MSSQAPLPSTDSVALPTSTPISISTLPLVLDLPPDEPPDLPPDSPLDLPTPPSLLTAPSAPSVLTATPADISIVLSWLDNSTNETGFMIEISSDGNTFTPFIQVIPDTTKYTHGNPSIGARYYYRVYAMNSAGSSSYSNIATATASSGGSLSNTPPPPPPPPPPPSSSSGLVGRWSFDEGSGTTASDVSGNGNTGTVNGATWTTGVVGTGALLFDGIDDYIDAGNSATLNPINAISVSAWVRVPSLPTSNQMIVAKYSETELQYFIRLQTTKKFRFHLTTGGVLGGPSDSTTLITANTWYHVVGTYDGSTVKLYVNGVLQSSASQTGTFANNGINLNIARQPGGMYFSGMLDDIRIYDQALSAAEILTLYTDSPNLAQGDARFPAMNLSRVVTHSILGAFADVSNTLRSIFCPGPTQVFDEDIPVARGRITDHIGINLCNQFLWVWEVLRD